MKDVSLKTNSLQLILQRIEYTESLIKEYQKIFHLSRYQKDHLAKLQDDLDFLISLIR
jgi:hypothetical protein